MRAPRVLNTFTTLPRGERIVYALAVVWVLAMIAVPIQRWAWGEASIPFGLTLGVGLQVAAGLGILFYGLGAGRAQFIAVIVVVCGWGVEYVGHTTGFPFGAYSYTNVLQPQLGGVPIAIPLAWLMMMPSAWAVAWLLTGSRSRVLFVLVSALAFTVWDLFLDPQMVGWNIWQFEGVQGFTYFGIPWSNYAGWLFASGAITALCLPLLWTPLQAKQLPLRPALILYGVTWVLETIGLIAFWGQPGPGIVGGIAMGAVLFLAVRLYIKQQKN